MALKWVSALVAATSLGAFAALNILAGPASRTAGHVALNGALLAICAGSVLLVVIAELHHRLDSRLSVVSDFLVTRLDEISGRLLELEARAASPSVDDTDAAVVRFAARTSRSRER